MNLFVFPLPKNITVKHREIQFVVLCGYERSSDRLREECKWRVFENRMLRLFEPKREGVTGG
jgi:hypothetical protein